MKLFLWCLSFFFAGVIVDMFFHARICQREVADKLVAIIGAAALDGAANGQRVRSYALQMESIWGGQVTNIAVLPDRVIIHATGGSRKFYDAMP